MELKLWGNIAKRNNSTLRPSGSYVSMDVVLKEGTSYENPTFILQADQTILDFNYCQFVGHYYFINDIVITRNNIYEIVCSQDVLATHKDAIGNYTCFVERSSYDHNQYFIDNEVSPTQNIVRKVSTNKAIEGLNTGVNTYILRIVGSSGNGINTYASASLSSYAALFDQSKYLQETEEIWAKISNLLFNPFDYVVSLSASPIELEFYPGNFSNVYAKWFNTEIRAKNVNTRLKTGSATLDVNNAYADFRKYHPSFTRYELYLPGVGLTSISPQDVTGAQVSVTYNIDLYTGAIAYVVLDTAHLANGPIATYSGSIYSQIQIGSNAWDSKDITIGAASAVSSAVAGNYLGAASSLTNAVTNIILPTPSIHGSSSDNLILENMAGIMLTTTNYGTGSLANDTCGRPLYSSRKLSEIPGYIKCGNASIPLAGLGNDAIAVNGYLNGGFYYE